MGYWIIVIILAGLAWFVYNLAFKQPVEVKKVPTVNNTDQTSFEPTPTSPLDVETIPELNPIKKANPFNGAYQNPFQK